MNLNSGSVVYIPYYLASIGEEIVKYSDIEENRIWYNNKNLT